MKIENIINYSFCHHLTAQAIVVVTEFCFIVSIPCDHLFFTVSMGMSSMWESQRPWEISAHIAKLLSWQHISHPGSDQVRRQTQSVALFHFWAKIRLESFSQDWSGFLFNVVLLHFCDSQKYLPWKNHRGISFFISSAGEGRKTFNLRLEFRGSHFFFFFGDYTRILLHVEWFQMEKRNKNTNADRGRQLQDISLNISTLCANTEDCFDCLV